MKPAGSAIGLGALALLLGACATGGAAAGTGAGSGQRSAPDDSELIDVVPAGPETLIALDVAQLRTSPWSKALVMGAPEDRAAKTAAQGFDEIADVDRAVFAVSEGGTGPTTLIVARGRFDADRIARAHGVAPAAQPPAWKETAWRDSRVWEGGDAAVALLTERTYLSGSPAAVREAIDCAWGLTPGVRQSGRLAMLEHALAGEGEGDGGRPALTAFVAITEAMRARVGADVDLPAGLEHVAVRLDLARALDLDVLALLATARDAAAAAHTLDATVRDLRTRKALNAFGLAAIFDGATVRADGTRVRGRLHVPEAKREDLSARITIVLQAIVRARSK